LSADVGDQTIQDATGFGGLAEECIEPGFLQVSEIAADFQLRFDFQQRTSRTIQELEIVTFRLTTLPSAMLLGTDTAASRT